MAKNLAFMAIMSLSAVSGSVTGTPIDQSNLDSIYSPLNLLNPIEIQINHKNLPIGDSLVESPAVHSVRKQVSSKISVWATAYTSDPGETDDTPFITASGSIVRDGIVASNFLPLGTKLMIPKYYGNKEFVVEDRMNSRYNDQPIIDIWFDEKTDAKMFGKRMVVIELL